MKKALIIIALFVLLVGTAMLFIKYKKTAKPAQQLAAEEVVDLEVEAQRQFIEAGGQY